MIDEYRYKRFEIEAAQGWREIGMAMPWIKFPAEWEVRIIPPFAGATARFCVRLPDGEEVSVYADHFNALGFYGGFDKPKPYWEVYPYRGDTGRCDIDDIRELLDMIGDRRPADDDEPTAASSGVRA